MRVVISFRGCWEIGYQSIDRDLVDLGVVERSRVIDDEVCQYCHGFFSGLFLLRCCIVEEEVDVRMTDGSLDEDLEGCLSDIPVCTVV